MNIYDYKIKKDLNDEEYLVAKAHKNIISNKNPAYFIPWSNRTEFPLIDSRNSTYLKEVIDFENICQNLKIKLDKLYKVNKKNKILLQTIVLHLVTRFYGYNFQEIENTFDKIKYFRFKRTGEIEVFSEKNYRMSFRIFLSYSYDYYKFHSENDFKRYALFEEKIEDGLIASLVLYPELDEGCEVSAIESRLYKKFLDEWIVEEKENG